jgi:hypothetical protein
MAGIMNESDEEADLNQLILDDEQDQLDGFNTFNSKIFLC